jgi:hypothetical protein
VGGSSSRSGDHCSKDADMCLRNLEGPVWLEQSNGGGWRVTGPCVEGLWDLHRTLDPVEGCFGLGVYEIVSSKRFHRDIPICACNMHSHPFTALSYPPFSDVAM